MLQDWHPTAQASIGKLFGRSIPLAGADVFRPKDLLSYDGGSSEMDEGHSLRVAFLEEWQQASFSLENIAVECK